MNPRRTVLSLGWFILCIMLVLMIPTQTARAYLDPGSGSLLTQILVAGILGLVVAVRLFWHQIIGFFRRGKPVEDDEAGNVENDHAG